MLEFGTWFLAWGLSVCWYRGRGTVIDRNRDYTIPDFFSCLLLVHTELTCRFFNKLC